MTMMRSLSLAAGLILVANAALAGPDLRLIVDRSAKAIEIFAGIEAQDLPDLLAADPTGLAAADGRVYFGALRETGTFDFGDEMISDVVFEVGGQATQLEAMSVMVHPQTNILPYATPIDGAIAMAVCGVPDPDEPPAIDTLKLYSGFIAYPTDGREALSLTLPNARPIEVSVINYVNGQEVGRDTVTLNPGEPLQLAANEGAWSARAWLTSLLGR